MIVGVNTEVIAGEGLIITTGGMDAHVHFICPQICDEVYTFDTVVDGVRRKVSKWFPHSLHHLMADVGASRSQPASGAIASLPAYQT